MTIIRMTEYNGGTATGIAKPSLGPRPCTVAPAAASLVHVVQKGVPLSRLPSASAASYSASTASLLSTTAPAAGTWALLPELLQQQLVRLACRSPPLALPVTRLLIQALTCSPLSSDTER